MKRDLQVQIQWHGQIGNNTVSEFLQSSILFFDLLDENQAESEEITHLSLSDDFYGNNLTFQYPLLDFG